MWLWLPERGLCFSKLFLGVDGDAAERTVVLIRDAVFRGLRWAACGIDIRVWWSIRGAGKIIGSV